MLFTIRLIVFRIPLKQRKERIYLIINKNNLFTFVIILLLAVITSKYDDNGRASRCALMIIIMCSLGKRNLCSNPDSQIVRFEKIMAL